MIFFTIDLSRVNSDSSMNLLRIERVSSDSDTSNSSGVSIAKFSTTFRSATPEERSLSMNFSNFLLFVFLRTITFTSLFSYSLESKV